MSSVNGIRRTIKVYGPVDPAQEAKRQRDQATGPIRKPHSGLVTSVRPVIRGDRIGNTK